MIVESAKASGGVAVAPAGGGSAVWGARLDVAAVVLRFVFIGVEGIWAPSECCTCVYACAEGWYSLLCDWLPVTFASV